MNPLRLWASGYRTFDELDLQIPDGCTAIVGPNGAGKSSILNVVDVVLFAERGELNDLLSTDHDALELGLEFEHAGETYRVRRQLRRGKSASLDFEQLNPEPPFNENCVWIPLTRETAAATQQLIQEVLGLTRTTFRASAFLRQGDSGAFTEAQPRDRKAILAEILQLERWELRRDRAAQAARGHDTELSKLEGRAELAELTAKQRPELERALEELRRHEIGGVELVDRAERAVDEAQQKSAASAAAKERVRACEAELAAARADEHRARDLLLEAQQANVAATERQAELDSILALTGRVPELERQLEDQRAQIADAQVARERKQQAIDHAGRLLQVSVKVRDDAVALTAEHEAVVARVAQLEQGDAHEKCVLCEQTLGAEARAATLTKLDAEVKRLVGEMLQVAPAVLKAGREATEALAAAEAIVLPDLAAVEDFATPLARAREAVTRKATLEFQIAGHAEKTVRLPLLQIELEQMTAVTAAKQTAVDEAKAQLGDTTELEQLLADLRATLTRTRTVLDQTRRDLAGRETQLELVVEAEKDLSEIFAARTKLQAELDLCRLAEKAFGRDGIPALIVEAVAVPQLESEANRILEQLPMTDGRVFRVELQTQAVNKSNDNVRETLDILVYDRDAVRPYETFSGGEKTRLNLALRLALAQLLAHRRGAESRLLCIDEPDGLDAGAMDALATVLQNLAGTFDKVLIVSHHVELASAFEQSITVTCESNRSRVDTGALEAVPA